MPQCSECRMLVGKECSAYATAKEVLGRQLPPPPLGACMIPIVEDYLSLISGGMWVLDVGCGSWSRIKDHCDRVGADYHGIDTKTEYCGKTTVATRLENLADLSFPDESFDVVIGNQTMEHWAENGCSLEWGLFQCFRVCKFNGRVLMNVPIHFHGTQTFMLGDLEKLQNLFAQFSTQVSFQKWGSPSAPLPSLFPYPGYSPLLKKPAYVLDIQAVKTHPIPTQYSNRAWKGRMAQILNYPLSYNIYRVFRKIGIFPKNFITIYDDVLH